MQNYTHVFTLRGIRRYEVKKTSNYDVQYCGYTPNIGNSNFSRRNIHAYTWNWNSLISCDALCRIKITVTAVTVIKTWRLPMTVRVVTCGFSLINAYMCVVANVYWVMTYVTLTVIFYMTYWCSGTTQN